MPLCPLMDMVGVANRRTEQAVDGAGVEAGAGDPQVGGNGRPGPFEVGWRQSHKVPSSYNWRCGHEAAELALKLETATGRIKWGPLVGAVEGFWVHGPLSAT